MDYEQKYKEAIERAKRMFSEKELNYLFPELKESKDEKIRKMCVRYLDMAYQHQSAAENRKNIEKCITWLEKRVKQTYAALGQSEVTNTSDQELEQKFHKGEWIISNNGTYTYQVREVKRGVYVLWDSLSNKIFTIGIEESERSGRLWSIQDAKDGDVLDANGAPFIYKKHDKDYVYFYCGVNLAGSFIEANEIDIWNNNSKVYPATKEQRDLLFQKMEEAGWEWDAENKHLTKI